MEKLYHFTTEEKEFILDLLRKEFIDKKIEKHHSSGKYKSIIENQKLFIKKIIEKLHNNQD